MTLAATVVGRTLAELGIRQVFGVVGSGNFHVTNALVDGGARFVAARHENGAATMADAYARMSGTVAALSVHQGCGLTNLAIVELPRRSEHHRRGGRRDPPPTHEPGRCGGGGRSRVLDGTR